MTDIHMRPTMSRIEPNNGLPFRSCLCQVLDSEPDRLSLVQIKADADLVLITQNYLKPK